jgi:hypothetical protein
MQEKIEDCASEIKWQNVQGSLFFSGTMTAAR